MQDGLVEGNDLDVPRSVAELLLGDLPQAVTAPEGVVDRCQFLVSGSDRRRYRLRRGSGGRGAAPGGEGIERDLQVLEPVTLSLITERRVSEPWGLAGGGNGAAGENWLLPAGDESRAERLPDKCTIDLAAGDVIRMRTPGGGGWGSPR